MRNIYRPGGGLRVEVLGWGILDEGERWTPSSDVFCLALMSRKAVPFPTKESSETFKRTSQISWQEDWVMLLQRSSSSTDTYQRIGVGKVFWKSWFQDELLQQARIV